MTEHPELDNIFQPDQIHSHTQIWGKTDSGKTVLVLDELSQTPSHLKINFRPNPSH